MKRPHRLIRSAQARAASRIKARTKDSKRQGETPAELPDQAEPKPKRDEKSRAARQERRKRRKEDISSAREKHERVRAIWEELAVIDGIRTSPGPRNITGLIDQKGAAARRVYRHSLVFGLRRTFLAKPGTYPQKYAVSLVKADRIYPVLDPKQGRKNLEKIRRETQRQAKRLPRPYLVTGHIDLCYLNDHLTGIQGWAFHVHLTITLCLDDGLTKKVAFKDGKRAIKAAFPLKPEPDRAVPKPRVIRDVYDARGWDFYQDKGLQWGGVRQRVVRVDSAGNRKKARKPPLTKTQEYELARFMAQVEPQNFTIWVGYREYQRRLISARRYPSKRRPAITPRKRGM